MQTQIMALSRSLNPKESRSKIEFLGRTQVDTTNECSVLAGDMSEMIDVLQRHCNISAVEFGSDLSGHECIVDVTHRTTRVKSKQIIFIYRCLKLFQ